MRAPGQLDRRRDESLNEHRFISLGQADGTLAISRPSGRDRPRAAVQYLSFQRTGYPALTLRCICQKRRITLHFGVFDAQQAMTGVSGENIGSKLAWVSAGLTIRRTINKLIGTSVRKINKLRNWHA